MERTSIETLKVLLRVASTLTGEAYELERWSPGDGWTRYRITKSGGSSNVSHYLTKAECETWIRAFILGAETALGHDRVVEIFAAKGNPWEIARNERKAS